MKFLHKLDILGFSLNPEHLSSIDPAHLMWRSIFTQFPRTQVIVLFRGNIIKSAISGYLGEGLKKKCGLNNLKGGHHIDTDSSHSDIVSVSYNSKSVLPNRSTQTKISTSNNMIKEDKLLLLQAKTNPCQVPTHHVDWTAQQFRTEVSHSYCTL